MPNFLYRDKQGREKTLAAQNRRAAMEYLTKNRIVFESLKKETGLSDIFSGFRVNNRDLAQFTRQFSTMISAGLSIDKILKIQSKQTENKTLSRTVSKILKSVESGKDLSTSLRDFPKVFSGLYCELVQAGEVGGVLDQTLLRLSDYLEKAERVKRRVRGALIYPAIVLVVTIGVIMALVSFVIPTFAEMFEDLDSGLPFATQIVVNISNFFLGNYLSILGAFFGAVIGFLVLKNRPKGRRLLDRLKLFMPIVGPLFRKSNIATFTRTLGTLLENGIPLITGLETTAKTSNNKILEEAIFNAKKSVSEGLSLADPLESTKIFPEMVIQMIRVGEETGELHTMLGKIADYYDDDVDVAVESITSIIEPVVIVVLGIIIGITLLALYMPMFDLINKVQ